MFIMKQTLRCQKQRGIGRNQQKNVDQPRGKQGAGFAKESNQNLQTREQPALIWILNKIIMQIFSAFRYERIIPGDDMACNADQYVAVGLCARVYGHHPNDTKHTEQQ
ncbi:hypothetical protein SDC9_198935 [bioreactor metagenome]|uniref:Uncharacterized protein n=1 Tax=bioreactor metagenome TaxID=1076179 RepID=A0A645IK93_9ZZZZ